jgi:hypothetical protein
MHISLDEWTQIAQFLCVRNGKATYGGINLITKKGVITVPDMPDGAKIS